MQIKTIQRDGYLGFNIKPGSKELKAKLASLFKAKRFPVELKLKNTLILGSILYEIEEKTFTTLVRKCIRAGMTSKDLEYMISDILKEKIETVTIGLGMTIERERGECFEQRKSWKIPKGKLSKKLNENYTTRRKIFQSREGQTLNSYFALPCVKALLAMGGNKGKRNHGAKVIAFACVNEGLSKQDALRIGAKYHQRIGCDDFPMKEVVDWINWAYQKNDLQWSCKGPQDAGDCDKSVCWIVKEYYAKRDSVRKNLID